MSVQNESKCITVAEIINKYLPNLSKEKSKNKANFYEEFYSYDIETQLEKIMQKSIKKP